MKDVSDLKREADTVQQSLLTCRTNEAVVTLFQCLPHMRSVVLETCRTIDPNSTEQLVSFKKAVHDAYWTITEPFNSKQTYEIQYKVYWDMLETIHACARLTGFDFDKGFEYANLSIAELGLRNLDQSFSHMELAKAEDDRIGHKTGVAQTHLRYIFDNAYTLIDAIIARSPLSNFGKASALCEAKLEWTEKCRLAKSMWKFHLRIKDNRSSLNNDDLERNLLNICKVVENYLKRKNPIPDVDVRRQTLTPLVDHTFRTGKSDWFDEWSAFRKSQGLDYSDPETDDKKLVSLLYDESRSHEANIFLGLCIFRNFGVHVFNDQSALFSEKEYDTAFSMCVEALMYTLGHV